MPADKQARMRDRIGTWARLTPDERARARENYKRLQALPPEERERMRMQLRREFRPDAASRPRRMASEPRQN
jgi:hypothetical protein